MNNKISNRVRLIISLAITLSIFFVVYIVLYWTYLNNKFKEQKIAQYTEVTENVNLNISTHFSQLKRDAFDLENFINSTPFSSPYFVDLLIQKSKKQLLRDDFYRNIFVIIEPKSSSKIKSSELKDELKRFSFQIDKDNYGGIAITNFQNNITSKIKSVYEENLLYPEKKIQFPYKYKNGNYILCYYPLRKNDKIIGLIGYTTSINEFSLLLKSIYEKRNKQINVTLLSSENKVISTIPYQSSSIIGQNALQLNFFQEKKIPINQKDSVYQLDDFIIISKKINTLNNLYSWKLILQFPKDTFKKATFNIISLNFILALLAFVALFFVLNFLFRTYNKEINNLIKFTKRLGLGLSKQNDKNFKTEELNVINDYLNSYVKFENELNKYFDKIYKRDYSSAFPKRSKNDELVKKINMIVDRLSTTRKKTEEQAKDVELRNWTRKALAEINTILAATNRSLEDISGATLSKFSELLGVSIGAIYILKNEQEQFLDLVKAFALNHEKQKTKKIKLGEGFVGAVALEQKPIFLDKVPENYLEISTGLGRTNPRFLAFIPLIFEQETIGVLELASLRIFKEHEQRFLLNVSKNLAVSLSGIIINQKTQQLLEQSKKQSEILQVREEELQQNISELQDLQDQTQKMSLRLNALTRSIDFFFFALEIDGIGRVLQVNTFFTEGFKIEEESLIGKNYFDYSDISKDSKKLEGLLGDIRKGLNRKEYETVVFKESKKNLINFYTPLKNEKGEIISIYIFGIDVTSYEHAKNQLSVLKFEKEKIEDKLKTELKEQEELNKRFRTAHKDLLDMIEAIDKRIIRIEYDLEGNITKANSLYYKFIGKETENLKSISELAGKDKELKKRWDKVLGGQINEVLTNIKVGSGKVFWWNIIDIPVLNRSGEIIKVISLAFDLTKEKATEIQAKNEASKLGIEIKKQTKKINELETKVNILSEENVVKEKLILQLKEEIKKLKDK